MPDITELLEFHMVGEDTVELRFSINNFGKTPAYNYKSRRLYTNEKDSIPVIEKQIYEDIKAYEESYIGVHIYADESIENRVSIPFIDYDTVYFFDAVIYKDKWDNYFVYRANWFFSMRRLPENNRLIANKSKEWKYSIKF